MKASFSTGGAEQKRHDNFQADRSTTPHRFGTFTGKARRHRTRLGKGDGRTRGRLVSRSRSIALTVAQVTFQRQGVRHRPGRS